MLAIKREALVAQPLPDASAKERAFLERSPSYRGMLATMANGVLIGQSSRVSQNGLTWWIPLDEGGSKSLARRVADGWLPMDQILRSRTLVAGGVMLDIGANIGTTALPRLVLGDFRYVYAAEPDPDNYACLVQNIVANGLQGRIFPDQIAMSDQDRDGVLRRSQRIGTPRLLDPTRVEGKSRELPVACRTLDSWVQELAIEPDEIGFIKSDTQGWEHHVLTGASVILQHRHIVWEVEVSPRLLGLAGSSVAALSKTLRTHFTHFVVEVRGAVPSALPMGELEKALEEAVGKGGRRFTNLLLFNADA
jgi:FkbM family methyltransferase